MKISVVMAVYNGEATLHPTIHSILGQTERDFELIIVNDGSTDRTLDIVRSYDDPRIRVVSQKNAGLTRALVKGCAEATGEYIARHDCGDISLPSRLARQRETLDQNAAVVFVSCWTDVVGPGGEPLFTMRGTGRAVTALGVIDLTSPNGTVDGPTHHGSVMFRRATYEEVGGYRPQFYYGQDWDLWYRLAELGLFVMEPEVLYTAAVTPDSISSRSRRAQMRIAELSQDALRARCRGSSESSTLEAASAVVRGTGTSRRAAGLYFIGEALRRRGDARSRGYFIKAIADTPWALRSWIRLAQSLFTTKTEDARR